MQERLPAPGHRHAPVCIGRRPLFRQRGYVDGEDPAVLPHADYIDTEQQFSRHAPAIRAAGRTIIASYHTGAMMPLASLFDKERELRAYGDMPKIVITPKTTADLVELVTFTEAAKKPIITGVMGSEFRYARAVLPLFGSAFVYCHTGEPTAEGQYSVEEFFALRNLLKIPG